MGVKATHRDYDKYSPKWKRVRDVLDGQDAMHKAGEAYLPKLTNESDADYKARVKRSDFFNASWRTVDGLSGLIFRKAPNVNVPGGIEDFLEDITLSDDPMDDFAEKCVLERLGPGFVGILVDHPPARKDEKGNVVSITKARAEAEGVRPTLQLYRAESFRNWKRRKINNAYVYSMVVLGEEHESDKDEFESEAVDRYRVLDLDENGHYRQRVFEVRDEKDVLVEGPIYPMKNGAFLTEIPFRTDGEIGEPPLIDLVDANVAHYQINSDYRHGGHKTALPTLFLSGVRLNEGESIYIGGSAAITSEHPEARGEYIEYKGQGLGALEKQLDRKERQMAVLGARMIADETRQVETLGATQIKRSGENSILGKIAKSVSRTLEWALTEIAEWSGHSGEVEYQLNRDFTPAMMDAQTLVAIFHGVQSGNISKREAFDLLQRGDVIDGKVTYEEHQEQIDAEPPPARPDPVVANEDDEEDAA